MTSAARRSERVADTLAVAALAILVLTSCRSSPQTRFYTLSPVGSASDAVANDQPALKISAVHIPGVLDRTSIIRAEANNQLSISSRERWGADLGEMIRRTLTQDLQQRLPDGMVVPGQSPAPANSRGLVVDIVYFGPASGSVKLDATWTLLDGSPPRVLLQRTAHLSAPGPQRSADRETSSSAAEQAAAMSAVLAHLADDIVGALSQLKGSQQ